jgi:hypothetical protein
MYLAHRKGWIKSQHIKKVCFIFRIVGFLDFDHRPVFSRLKNTMFQELVLLLSSGEGRDTYSVGSLRKS